MENTFIRSRFKVAAFHMYLCDIAEGNVKVDKPELRKAAIYLALIFGGKVYDECYGFSEQYEETLDILHDELWQLFMTANPQYNFDNFRDTISNRLDNLVEHEEEWIRECDKEIKIE